MNPPPYDDDYATCQETYATLCLHHDDLNPEAVSKLLGVAATSGWMRGASLKVKGRQPRFARTGGWLLSSRGVVNSKDTRRHLDWTLHRVEPQSALLKRLQAQGYDTRIFCYWLSAAGHGGPTLSPEQMRRLADLGLEIGFDIYFAADDEVDDS